VIALQQYRCVLIRVTSSAKSLPLKILRQRLLQHSPLLVQVYPFGRHIFEAPALSASPKQVSPIPAGPAPNRFSACRRVTDWANPLASSSNLFCLTFLPFFLLCLFLV
jgi:hypothetical protein